MLPLPYINFIYAFVFFFFPYLGVTFVYCESANIHPSRGDSWVSPLQLSGSVIKIYLSFIICFCWGILKAVPDMLFDSYITFAHNSKNTHILKDKLNIWLFNFKFKRKKAFEANIWCLCAFLSHLLLSDVILALWLFSVESSWNSHPGLLFFFFFLKSLDLCTMGIEIFLLVWGVPMISLVGCIMTSLCVGYVNNKIVNGS